MSDLRRWFRQGLTAQIDALDAAKAALEAGDAHAADSIRRLSRSLGASGFVVEFPEFVDVATAVEEADDLSLTDAAAKLLATLRKQATGREDARVKILIIEHDPNSAQLLRATLSNQNREVMIVDTATDAEAILAEDDIALIVLDLVLPDTDGRNLLLKLRQRPRTAATPIFVVSGLDGTQPLTECMALGADKYFTKPVSPEALSASVSAKLQRAAEISMHARHDALTGLKNRAAFTEAFEHELSVSQRNQMPLSIAIFDIDRFKRVNDLYGSVRGDDVLRKLSRWIAETLRKSDLVARWGGDEFALLFPGTDVSGSVLALQKVQEVLREHPVIVDGVIKVRVTCSAGVASVTPDMSIMSAISAAERQLYLAKVSGRNRIISSDDAIEPAAKTILLAEDDAVTAKLIGHRLRREGFEVVHFDNGTDAVAAAPDIEASLVILESMMPGIDGFELLRQLRRMPVYTDVPILMLTPTGRDKEIVRAFDLGASDYVTKPFSAAELVARVQRLLREYEAVPRR